MGKPILNLDDRNAVDSMMLTHTTKPLSEDLQITGTPVINLKRFSTHQEGTIGRCCYEKDILQKTAF